MGQVPEIKRFDLIWLRTMRMRRGRTAATCRWPEDVDSRGRSTPTPASVTFRWKSSGSTQLRPHLATWFRSLRSLLSSRAHRKMSR